jgi:hypothetical protein
MHGNVAEMCSDFWGPAYHDRCLKDGLVIDPKGLESNPGFGRVVRGSSFLDVAYLTRSACRHRLDPNLGYCQVGFRVVCEVPPTSDYWTPSTSGYATRIPVTNLARPLTLEGGSQFPTVSTLGRKLVWAVSFVFISLEALVSIVRVGLAETKHFSEGYAAIFGSKKKKDAQEKPARPATKVKKEHKQNKAGKKNGKK